MVISRAPGALRYCTQINVDRLHVRHLLSDDRKAVAAGTPVRSGKSTPHAYAKRAGRWLPPGMEEKPRATGREPLPGTPAVCSK